MCSLSLLIQSWFVYCLPNIYTAALLLSSGFATGNPTQSRATRIVNFYIKWSVYRLFLWYKSDLCIVYFLQKWFVNCLFFTKVICVLSIFYKSDLCIVYFLQKWFVYCLFFTKVICELSIFYKSDLCIVYKSDLSIVYFLQKWFVYCLFFTKVICVLSIFYKSDLWIVYFLQKWFVYCLFLWSPMTHMDSAMGWLRLVGSIKS